MPVLQPLGLWVGLQSAVLHTSEARTGAEVQNHKDDDDDGGDERCAKYLGLRRRGKREKGKGKKQRDQSWSHMEMRKHREKPVIFSRRFSIDQYDTRHGTDQSISSPTSPKVSAKLDVHYQSTQPAVSMLSILHSDLRGI